MVSMFLIIQLVQTNYAAPPRRGRPRPRREVDGLPASSVESTATAPAGSAGTGAGLAEESCVGAAWTAGNTGVGVGAGAAATGAGAGAAEVGAETAPLGDTAEADEGYAFWRRGGVVYTWRGTPRMPGCMSGAVFVFMFGETGAPCVGEL